MRAFTAASRAGSGSAVAGEPLDALSEHVVHRDDAPEAPVCADDRDREHVVQGEGVDHPGDAALLRDRVSRLRPGRHLTARWGLFQGRFGRTQWLPNEHEPWVLHPARLISLRDELCAAAGLPGVVQNPPDSVLFSPGVDARFGRGTFLPRGRA